MPSPWPARAVRCASSSRIRVTLLSEIRVAVVSTFLHSAIRPGALPRPLARQLWRLDGLLSHHSASRALVGPVIVHNVVILTKSYYVPNAANSSPRKPRKHKAKETSLAISTLIPESPPSIMLKLVVLVALVAAANGASCPAVCLTCLAGGAGGGTSLVGGVCHASCSASGYCGTSDAYTNGGTDCTGCAETPTASQRANLKLADAHYVTNTKASIAAAELLYKQTVVEFSALFNAGSLLTKSAKMRYNYLLAHDSRKPAAEQALLCEDTCSPTGTWSHMSNCNLQYCIDKQTAGWCDPNDAGHQYARNECQKTCDLCKTPYAASELSSLLGRRSNDQCSDGVQNGDETGVDCGGSCSVCPVDCVSSETTCTCTPACGNTCDCTDTITITTPAAGRGQACPSATVRTFTGAACPWYPSTFTRVPDTGCSGKNELGTQTGFTLADAKAYCASQPTCVSFEQANEVLSHWPFDMFQFSTSCTASVGTTYTMLDLWVINR